MLTIGWETDHVAKNNFTELKQSTRLSLGLILWVDNSSGTSNPFLLYPSQGKGIPLCPVGWDMFYCFFWLHFTKVSEQ